MISKISILAASLFALMGGTYYVINNQDSISDFILPVSQKINENLNGTIPVFSEDDMLEQIWSKYKIRYVEEDTFRTIDLQRDGITTSEGQSYTMLRSVWQDDKDIFDSTWKWTKDNLWKDNDLFAWMFGELENGEYGILESQGGNNSATDADTDIALALVFAFSRWQDPVYLLEADTIIKAIWAESVVEVNGKPYLVANDIEQLNEDQVILNPSYFAPYAYRIFAEIDTENDWNGLVATSYEVIQNTSRSNLDEQTSSGLVPDWVILDRNTGRISPSSEPTLTTRYGFDAMRTPWRIALDWEWYKEPIAYSTLERFAFLEKEWNESAMISNVYTHDGTSIAPEDSPAAYATSIGYFKVISPSIAEDIYDQKLLSLYTQDTQSWKEPLSYYDDNWAWFGMSLYLDELPNYFELVNQKEIKNAFENTNY